MVVIPTPAPAMSPAQRAALNAAVADPDGFVRRGGRVSSSILISLCTRRRRWADLVWETAEDPETGKPVTAITGAAIRNGGRQAVLLVNRDAAQAERDAAITRVTAVVAADPFAVFRRQPELVIPF